MSVCRQISTLGGARSAPSSMSLDIGGSGSIDAEIDTAELHAGISGSGSSGSVHTY